MLKYLKDNYVNNYVNNYKLSLFAQYEELF